MVDEFGKARIADFGLARVIYTQATFTEASASGKGTVKWQAPELLDGSNTRITPESDVYSYGCLCLEVLNNFVFTSALSS